MTSRKKEISWDKTRAYGHCWCHVLNLCAVVTSCCCDVIIDVVTDSLMCFCFFFATETDGWTKLGLSASGIGLSKLSWGRVDAKLGVLTLRSTRLCIVGVAASQFCGLNWDETVRTGIRLQRFAICFVHHGVFFLTCVLIICVRFLEQVKLG